ncbi:PQ loop repeat-domain-containing protein [Gorgonomyces haynaldii]|nr:PQ loop repeat-domain-containing protein [Gorgonomyces haynaldii]
MCECSPQTVEGHAYIQWIGTFFGDCVYTPMDQASFALGLISLVCSMFSTLPQIIKNYRKRSVRGLSLGLVLFWTLGDISNWLGTILANQLPTQKLTALFYVSTDVFMVAQYVIYSRYDYERLPEEDEEVQTNVQETSAGPASVLVAAQGVSAMLCNQHYPGSSFGLLAGKILAWCSGLFYFISRIPQLYENYKLKSVKGLSGALLILTVLGNVTYGLSILLRFPPIDNVFFESTLPYLIGSMGTLIFDFATLGQAYYYGGF